jgi:stringent starvation protein B
VDLSPIKRQLLELLLGQNGLVHVKVKVFEKKVIVPKPLKEQGGEIIFVLGNAPTPHIAMDNYGIKAPMRFGSITKDCFFPWSSITMITDEKVVLMLNDKMFEKEKKEDVTPKKPTLTLIKD